MDGRDDYIFRHSSRQLEKISAQALFVFPRVSPLVLGNLGD